MSSYFLRLIPIDPTYLPDGSVDEQLKSLLVSWVPDALSIEIHVFDDVKFIDQGEYFERVSCPLCHEELSTKWWQSAMDTAYKTCFENLDTMTPCCTQPISLNELNYAWPAGFAKFIIEIQEPNIKGFETGQVQHLKTIIGIELRQIWAYY